MFLKISADDANVEAAIASSVLFLQTQVPPEVHYSSLATAM